MLAFSAVTQFPTNGFSTRETGERVQVSSSAEHMTTAETRRIVIASPQLGTTRIFSTGSRLYTRQARCDRSAERRFRPEMRLCSSNSGSLSRLGVSFH